MTPVRGREVCDGNVLNFLIALSQRLFSDPAVRPYSDLLTFAFFCRKSSLIRIKESSLNSKIRRGHGTVLHIAPANIPITAAFTFAFGLLSGNSNVVRLPSKKFPQIDLFLDAYNDVVDREEFFEIKNSNLFIRTERESSEIVNLVSNSDALVVWGGDETVKYFRALEKKPLCSELYFPNRSSSLIISSEFVNNLDKRVLSKALEAFYNDSFLIDQNACSSPMTISFIGDRNSSDHAIDLFFKGVENLLVAKNYKLSSLARIDRYLDIMRDVEDLGRDVDLDQRAHDIWLQKELHAVQGRFGRFVLKNRDSIEEFLGSIDGEQTLTYFGFPTELLKTKILESRVAIDRVVPMGRALEIGVVWDGIEILYRLSRITTFE